MQGTIRAITRGGRKRYEVVVDLGRGEDGRRRQRTRTCETRKEAERCRREWVRQIERGEAVERAPDTVAELLTDYLASRALDLRPNSLRGYQSVIRAHLIPHFGALPVQKLGAGQIERGLSRICAGGASPRTAGYARTVLMLALDRAVRDGLVARNEARRTRPLRPAPRELQTWSVAEAQVFLAAAAAHGTHGPIWALSLTTGLRQGELLGLRWRDVDLDGGRLHVRQTLVIARGADGHHHPTFGPPKSRAGRRTVALARELVALLRAHRLRQAEARLLLGTAWTAGDLVFTSHAGTPWLPKLMSEEKRRLVQRAGVPMIRVHDQRHTFVTHALADGAPLRDLSALIGHSRASTTMDVYAHAIAERQAAIAAAAAARLLPPLDADAQAM